MSPDSSAPTPIATWNPARGVWETNQTAICGHSEPFSQTWPKQGSMRNGAVFARPTPAPRTDGNGCLSLLPTPEAKLSGSGPDYARANREGSGGDDLTTAVHKHLTD